ncbi:MAG: tripartite tricarboxylate transporter TctB family protein [Dehalococcoidia bacterium]|jgi:putative tricarboxylic transport membrane protein|nr:tripartite tricarboxylate transporter TctB family protein [Dehalococcoidia bacterium]
MNSRRLDIVTGTVIIAFACFVLAYSSTFPPAKGTDFGPSLFPRVVAVMLLILGAILLLHVWRAGAQAQSSAAVRAGGELSTTSAGVRNVVVTVIAIVAYIALVDRLGFVPTTLVFLFVLMKTYRLTTLRSIAASCVITGFVYVLFSVLLRVTLP